MGTLPKEIALIFKDRDIEDHIGYVGDINLSSPIERVFSEPKDNLKNEIIYKVIK